MTRTITLCVLTWLSAAISRNTGTDDTDGD